MANPQLSSGGLQIRPNFQQQFNNQQFNNSTNDQNLSPLRKNLRMRAFHRLLVRQGEAH
jgi:hypothetical protein